MRSARTVLARVARAGSRPVRGYVNEHVEAIKSEVRQRSADEREASELDLRGVRIAIDRLEEAIGFLGMQLSVIRTVVEQGSDAAIIATDEQVDAATTEALTALGFDPVAGRVFIRQRGHEPRT